MYLRLSILSTLLLVLGCQTKKSDLEAYLDTIRASGMSEGAQTALRSVAELTTQKTLVSFEKDKEGGPYDRLYRSAACPLPNATKKQLDEWKRGLIESADREVTKFSPLADSDNSDFITTAEAENFRRTYEIGTESAHLCQVESCTLEVLSKGIGMQAPSLLELLKSYDKIQQRATSQHLRGFPRVPLKLEEAGRP